MDGRICLLFLLMISPCIALECSSCMHMGIEYINMPANIESMMAGMMSALGSLKNERCSNNTAPTETCAVSSGVDTVIDTCISFTFTMTCMGFTDANLPESGLSITVVTRQCSGSPVGTEDSCRKIDTLADAEGQAEIIKSLDSLKDSFKSVEYNGDYCTTSTGILPSTTRVTDTTKATRNTITTEPTSGSSALIYLPSIAVFLFVLHFV
ncbi:uncharacterized protein LOC128244905 isoform X1 [Mya arenaria]|uniref:uncharacterized protein LOC128244905 isoform X1 n=2 Tax=Mya arenaria TaxID=6604 RepID=UPI0022E62D20|nr:uncharacterized protein LOC128244905 isoform X1 [Mya arenaria]